jgi:hypothetical protein
MEGSESEIESATEGRNDYQRMRLGNLSVAYAIPEAWQRFAELSNGTGLASQGTLFLGRRSHSDGTARLVAIDAYISHDLPRRIFLLPRVIEPGSLLGAPDEAMRQTAPFFLTDADGELRIRAGSVDPRDASHFSIEYTGASPKLVYRLGGWLRDDDSVYLEQQTPRQIIPAAPLSQGQSR